MVGQLIVMVYSRSPVQELASVAVTLNVNDPAVVGEPEIAPAAERVSPSGRLPLVSVYEYGAMPPPAMSVCEYEVPMPPFGKDVGVIVIVGQLIVSVKFLKPVQPLASVAVTVTLKPPTSVGIPERAPLEESNRPAGSDPFVTANEYGAVPPLADTV